MNQEQLKTALLYIEDAPLDFTVIFSGKKSKKVNGLYKPENREIIIHNRNFNDDNLLIYTAIHEYAHHLHACSQNGRLSMRSHTTEFWAIFHRLLEKAETIGTYKNVFSSSPELNELTNVIRQKYLKENGELVKQFGFHLLKAHELCLAIGGRFDDYIDRILRIPKSSANTAIKMYEYDLDTSLGADNMRFIAGIRNEDERLAAEKALINGKSPDTVKSESKKLELEPKIKLEKERTRLEKTIDKLSKRLGEVEKELELY